MKIAYISHMIVEYQTVFILLFFSDEGCGGGRDIKKKPRQTGTGIHQLRINMELIMK